MKKNIILALLLSLTATIYSQNVKGILVQKFVSGYGDDVTLSEKEKAPIVFSYIYSNKKSLQSLISKDKSSVDTIYTEKYGIKLPKENIIIAPSSQKFYKDFEADLYKAVSTKNKVDFCIKDKLSLFDWTFINETKEVNGYKCKKATTLNKLYGMDLAIVAWYCESIPVNDGPMNYSGLPGFIMEIEIGKFTVFTFEKLVFSKEKTDIAEPFNSAKDITFKEYRERK